MRIKIIGFKVGVARPTYNKTIDMTGMTQTQIDYGMRSTIGREILKALSKSDFLSIRQVE